MTMAHQKEDIQLVYNALFTLVHQTDYDIAWKNCQYVCDPEDVMQVTAQIFSEWTKDELYQVLASDEDAE